MENLSEKLVKILQNKNKTISFMESCTGGFLANEITNICGASNVLKVSLVTYSNEYKIKFGVNEHTINKYSVYSLNTAKEMSNRISEFANSTYGIGITGILNEDVLETCTIYYSIYNKYTNKYYEDTIILNGDKRRNIKKVISNIIFKDLLNIIKRGE